MSSDYYCKQDVANIESELDIVNSKLPKSAETPLNSGYIPELDNSREISSLQIN